MVPPAASGRVMKTGGCHMVRLTELALTAALVLGPVACGGEGPDAVADITMPDSLGGVPADTVVKWVEYAESSDEGLWEERTDRLLFVPSDSLGGGMDPPFYDPYSFCAAGDTLYVADQSTCQVVAVRAGGEALWRAGGQGEGPGRFSRMGGIAVSSRHVCALNPVLGRAEIFGRGGEFIRSLEIQLPHDACGLSDGRFAVASRRQPGGHLHLVDPDSGVVHSFGEAVVGGAYDNIGMMDMLKVCAGPGDTLAVFNRYQGTLAVYEPEGWTCVYRGSRTFPDQPEPPRMEQSGDEMRFYMFPMASNAFVGPEGQLNTVIHFQSDGSFLSEMGGSGQSPVTVVDRYSWSGQYLDSYCLPDSFLGSARKLGDGRLAALDYRRGTLRLFRRLER